MAMATRTICAFCLVVLSTGLFAGTRINSRRERAAEQPDYNIKLGELSLDGAYRLGLSYDDNTNSIYDTNLKEESTDLENGIDIRAYWPLTPGFLLDVNLYLGYISTLSGEGKNGFVARTSADESLALDMLIGDNSTLSLIDTININTETAALSAQDRTEDLRTLVNDLALQYEVDLSEYYSLLFRLGRETTRTLGTSDFENRDAQRDYLALGLDWQMNSNLSLGPYISFRRLRHKEEINNDSDEYEIGIRGTYQATEVTHVSLSLGYQNVDFDTDNDPTATEDSGNIAASLAINSALSDSASHGLIARYENVPGTIVGVNSTQDLTLTYNLKLALTDELQTTFVMSYFRSREDADQGDDSHTFMPGIRVDYRYSERLSFNLNLQAYKKHSREDEQREFSRHVIAFGMAYDF